MEKKKTVPVFLIVGHGKVGKTTLIEKLIPELMRRGFRVGTVKHAFHGLEMDTPGKDTWRHRAAGASTVVAASGDRVAVIRDASGDRLEDLLVYFTDVDLVLAEGFKKTPGPKFEVFRKAVAEAPVALSDPDLLALATDDPVDTAAPVVGLSDISAIADRIVERMQ